MLIRKRKIELTKMIKIENWIIKNNEYFSGDLWEESLVNKLNLKVVYLDCNDLPLHVEAMLCPCEDNNYNGLIKINKKYAETRFAYIHEIIHYLHDVGVGKKVCDVYMRKTKGNTLNEYEQYINYATAAVILKYEKMKELINYYDNSKPKVDELKFVYDICEKYNQKPTTVFRRIREVRTIMRKKEAMQNGNG